MSEKEKRKPDQQASSFLTPDDASSFFYETPASIGEVKQALLDFESDGFLKHTILLTPAPEGYDVRYDIIRHGRMGAGLSAYAQGHLRQNQQGQTVLEGTIRVAMSDNQFLLLSGVSVIVIPLLLLLLPVLLVIVTQRTDARRIRDNIAQVAANLQSV